MVRGLTRAGAADLRELDSCRLGSKKSEARRPIPSLQTFLYAYNFSNITLTSHS